MGNKAIEINRQSIAHNVANLEYKSAQRASEYTFEILPTNLTFH